MNISSSVSSAPLPSGPGKRQVLFLAASGWMLAPVVAFVERYLWSDWQFALALALLVVVDTLTGFARAWQQKTLNSKAFSQLFIKILAYGATLVTLHTISHHTVQGEPNSVLAALVPYFDSVGYAAILVREALSIHENLAALGYPLLPPSLQKRFKEFQQKASEE